MTSNARHNVEKNGTPEHPPYREVTVAAMLLGIAIGVVLTAAMTYAGLVIGFVVNVSAIAALLGWGLLRGVLKRGSIVENNINQTVASAINNTSAGVIFTFPVLFLMEGVSFNPWAIAAAAMAGAVLGTLFIIPLRKQMIEFERLRFPSGMAVAEILRSPGVGMRKSALLAIATIVAIVFTLMTDFGLLPRTIDAGSALGLPAYVPFVWALMLLSVGAGFITGRTGLIVLAGGILAHWLIAPLVVTLGWIQSPAELPIAEGMTAAMAEESWLAASIFLNIIRPLGIGLLVGGALAGVFVAAPMIFTAFRSLKRGTGGGREELPVSWMYSGVSLSLIIIFGAAWLGDPDIGFVMAILTAIIGVLWMWLAGVIVAQCAGRTDWSPVSGLALVAVTIILVVSGGSVGVAVLIGAAVCVAIGQGSDMMADLKTGFLVGSRPVRQQMMQIALSWIGPGISVLTVYLIWQTVQFGPANPDIPAPQAATLQAVIESVRGGDVPLDKYIVGALVGAILTLGTGGGFGVMVGLSMYLPMAFVLPYGLGCIISTCTEKLIGRTWNRETGIPVAAGLLVGGALAGVIFSIYKLFETAL